MEFSIAAPDRLPSRFAIALAREEPTEFANDARPRTALALGDTTMHSGDRRAQCPKIFYSPQYNRRLPTWRRLHPFDLQKYRRVAAALQEFSCSSRSPRGPVSLESLRRVHTDGHLQRVFYDRQTIAVAAEVPLLRHVPWINRLVIEAMRWATQGTIDAVAVALEEGMAINLSGGYHHAKPDRAEGFCFLADAAVAIREMRARGVLQPEQTVLHLDVDAHMGNGPAHCFMDDPTVKLFDFYSDFICPTSDSAATSRIDFGCGLDCTIRGAEYLTALKEQLPAWLDLIQSQSEVALAILNLGHDVLEQDPLTFMRLSAEDVYERDRYLVGELRSRRIPVVILLSGGYSHGVHAVTAESLRRICRSATQAGATRSSVATNADQSSLFSTRSLTVRRPIARCSTCGREYGAGKHRQTAAADHSGDHDRVALSSPPMSERRDACRDRRVRPSFPGGRHGGSETGERLAVS